MNKSYDYRKKAVAMNLRGVFTTKLWEVTSLDNEDKLPLVSPADRYERDDIAKVVTSWPAVDQPTQAWLQHWGNGQMLNRDLWLNNMANNFNIYPTAYRRDWKWAYVMWDDGRLADWKGALW